MAITREQAERARAIREQIHRASGIVAETADNATLFEMPMMFDLWKPGVSYAAGTVFRHGEGLYRVQQNVLSQAHQPPDGAGMLAVYAPVQRPAEGGQVLPWVNGETGIQVGDRRAYNGVVYKCIQAPGANIWPPDSVPALWKAVEP